MKRDLAILALVALVAAAGTALFVRSRNDGPSPVEKVERGLREFPDVRHASCDELSDRRFRCRVTRRRGRIDDCRAQTDAEGRLSRLSCVPRRPTRR